MGDAIPMDPTRRFSDRVEFYVRSRPKYPPAVLNFCRSKLGLRASHRIADVGSGTGILSELFLGNGNEVFAIEPNAEMRKAAEASLSHDRNFHGINGAAEATGLAAASADFIIAGQAFHWFDRPRTRREFSPILAAGGWVLLIWNDRKVEPGGFAADYDAMVHEFETDFKHVSHLNMTSADSGVLKEFFAPCGFEIATFDNPQSLDLDGVLARAMSSSYLPSPGKPRCEEMLQRLREVYDRHQIAGRVVQPYDTKVYYGRLE